MQALAYTGGVAVGEWSCGPDSLCDLSRAQESIRQNSRSAGPQRIRPGDRHPDCPSRPCRRRVLRQSLCAAHFFSESTAAKLAGRRVAVSVVAALGTRVRNAVYAAGQLGGGACRRNELELEQ